MSKSAEAVTPLAAHADYKAVLKKRDDLDARFAVAVERERRARNRLSAQMAVARRADDAASAQQQERERRAADAERAKALVAGGSLVVAPAAQIELDAALEEQRLLRIEIFGVNEELEAVHGRLFTELLEREDDFIRGNRRRKKEAEAASKREDENLDSRFAAYRAAGFRFFALDVLRRVTP